MSVLTWTPAPTSTIGLVMSGRAGITTRNCVLTGIPMLLNENVPSTVLVTTGVPTFAKPAV